MNTRFLTRAMLALAIIASSLLTGCASIVSGSTQLISVEARNQGQLVKGASCKLQNAKGTFYVTSPGTVTVHKSRDDLLVQCDKESIKSGQAQLKSTVKGMTFGNILFGGIVGVVIDQNSGAAFDYPSVVTVFMGENRAAQMAAFTPPAAATPPAALNMTTVAGAPPGYPQRQLMGEEMHRHFSSLGTVMGHSPSGAKMQYDINSSGGFEVRNLDKGGGSTGSYEFKDAENQICLGIYGGSGWRVMQDCYRLYQISADTFAMKSATDNFFFTYVKQQPYEADNSVASQAAVTLPAAVAYSAPVTAAMNPVQLPATVQAAAVQPDAASAPASTPEAQSGIIGQYSYQSEHIAKAQSCAAQPHAILSAKGPGFESYTVSCDSGDSLAMRCDFGQCRILK
ncbi:hypothetical protein [Collimonas sp.]|jgi:hypothetical protein|uniref:hypothetical protein n=1 Tax=Collimonas sp. TaxID=1963772 RepID=UPI002B5F48A1|nr:hypothetical protein [Collimonas sp.]HWX03846.1 hypothetical protein [Collimonas sp.]